MIRLQVENFQEWRSSARLLLAEGVSPSEIEWLEKSEAQGSLLGEPFVPPALLVESLVLVPRDFIALAQKVACHRQPEKWSRLYSLLWRITQGEKNLLKISTDPLVNQLLLMQKAVGRDVHKMKAFVRFECFQKDGDSVCIA